MKQLDFDITRIRVQEFCTSSSLVTHRRCVAKRGGCFQRRLFVCLFVRMTKLGGSMHCTKFSPDFECQDQRSTSPGTKNEKNAESSPLTMHGKATRAL